MGADGFWPHIRLDTLSAKAYLFGLGQGITPLGETSACVKNESNAGNKLGFAKYGTVNVWVANVSAMVFIMVPSANARFFSSGSFRPCKADRH